MTGTEKFFTALPTDSAAYQCMLLLKGLCGLSFLLSLSQPGELNLLAAPEFGLMRLKLSSRVSV